jgi:hypothetical protein
VISIIVLPSAYRWDQAHIVSRSQDLLGLGVVSVDRDDDLHPIRSQLGELAANLSSQIGHRRSLGYLQGTAIAPGPLPVQGEKSDFKG